MNDIRNYMIPGKRAHLVGIGGVSMCPLAEVLHGAGIDVHGSDMRESAAVDHLRSIGIDVDIGHYATNIDGCDYIIRTAAVHDDNPEIAAARASGIPVFERAQAWGAIMRKYKNAVCISGTHGKTTTTSMATHIGMSAAIDPTIMIGGTLPLLGSGHRVGHGDTIILESCEYCNSFLNFFPTIAVILNIEADHLDFFKDLDDIKHSFRKFALLVPDNGSIIANMDDANTMDALRDLGRKVLTFGVKSESADFRAVNITHSNGCPVFDILAHDKIYAHIALRIPGDHNIINALAATAAAYQLGIAGPAVEAGLSSFSGAGRRFEHKGNYNGAEVYDDYAHHPGELHALLTMVKTLGYKRVICAFQPHTYSRTKALFEQFVEELKIPDVAVLMEIYAAREKNNIGISSKDISARIPNSIYCATLCDVTETLRKLARPGDIILTVGAGDIYLSGEKLLVK
ncbi:MAG: UDP-N-acetylmuramate--L-alanine ligase [Oscillospiraceae bacterium]|nr:UDP-N-acetylmuramate--L-alanine ligase [Oscillospiraceae bacterium]